MEVSQPSPPQAAETTVLCIQAVPLNNMQVQPAQQLCSYAAGNCREEALRHKGKEHVWGAGQANGML